MYLVPDKEQAVLNVVLLLYCSSITLTAKMSALAGTTSSTTLVNIVTQPVKMDNQNGRYRLKFIVSPLDKTSLFLTQQEEEANENEIDGQCSSDIELRLKHNRCDIQFSVSGALIPRAELEKGEDIIQFSTVFGDAKQKEISLKPTYDQESDGIATIKFKVDGNVEHTVHIFDIPTEDKTGNSRGESIYVGGKVYATDRSPGSLPQKLPSELEHYGETRTKIFSKSLPTTRQSATRLRNRSSSEKTAESRRSRTVRKSESPASDRSRFTQNVTISSDQKSEKHDFISGGVFASDDADFSDASDKMDVSDRSNKEETTVAEGPAEAYSAYKKILSDKSLLMLVRAMDVSQANMLLVCLEVPSETLRHFQRNHPHDVVSANLDGLSLWRNQNTQGSADGEAYRKLYYDLLEELKGVHRTDLVNVLECVLPQNRQLVAEDFRKN